MKKRIVIPVIIVIALALVLFLPIPLGSYDDGGTRAYAAFTYKIIVWNKYYTVVDESGQLTSDITTYHKISVYWYPDNQKNIDDLWQMEIADN